MPMLHSLRPRDYAAKTLLVGTIVYGGLAIGACNPPPPASQADVYQARIALNRLLHRRLEEGFLTQAFTLETVLDRPLSEPEAAPGQVLFRSRRQVVGYTATPLHFEIFREFMVEEGIGRLCEIQELPEVILAEMVEHYVEDETEPGG